MSHQYVDGREIKNSWLAYDTRPDPETSVIRKWTFESPFFVTHFVLTFFHSPSIGAKSWQQKS